MWEIYYCPLLFIAVNENRHRGIRGFIFLMRESESTSVTEDNEDKQIACAGEGNGLSMHLTYSAKCIDKDISLVNG